MSKDKSKICRSFRQDFPEFVARAEALDVQISLGEGRRNGRERVFWLDGYRQLTGYTTRSDGLPFTRMDAERNIDKALTAIEEDRAEVASMARDERFARVMSEFRKMKPQYRMIGEVRMPNGDRGHCFFMADYDGGVHLEGIGDVAKAKAGWLHGETAADQLARFCDALESDFTAKAERDAAQADAEDWARKCVAADEMLDATLAGAVKVKPLVWTDFREGGTCGRPHHFQYFVTQDRHGRFWAHFDMSQHDNLDDAKRHCDRHHQRATLQPDPDARQADLSDAARDVLAERARQISVEGWTPGHDDTHEDGEMAEAAGCYALNAAGWKTEAIRGCWPIKWMAAWFKPTDPRRDLVKAGALCIAEIERLDRALTPPADLAAKIGGE